MVILGGGGGGGNGGSNMRGGTRGSTEGVWEVLRGGMRWECHVWYGAYRLKRVPMVFQNVMPYIIRARVVNKKK